jgi:hypothetical protein
MTERKFTDEQIIKALEHCTSSTTSEACNGCPFYDTDVCIEMDNALNIYALDLINRQRAEIERLHSEVKEKTETIVFLKDQATGWSIDFCNLKAKLNTAKSEAIKEFAEGLKKRLERKYTIYGREYVLRHLRELVKEMTEGSNDLTRQSLD